MTLNARSQQTLTGIHPDLVRVVIRAHALCEADGLDFIVTDGVRSKEKQAELVRAGKSKTNKSRHLTGHAVDLCASHGPKDVSWEPADLKAIAQRMKAAATELGVALEWGGDWKSFIDMPHYQLPWKKYPVGATAPVAVAEQPAQPEPAAVVPAPAGELKKSGTIWGSIGAAFAGLSMYFEQAFQTLVQAGSALTELGPAQGLLASVGANTKALSLGLLVMCVGVVISRRVKAKQEGKAG